MRAFLAACQQTLDADADRIADIAINGYKPEHADWLWANTVELSDDPQDWPVEFRELWQSLLLQHMQD